MGDERIKGGRLTKATTNHAMDHKTIIDRDDRPRSTLSGPARPHQPEYTSTSALDYDDPQPISRQKSLNVDAFRGLKRSFPTELRRDAGSSDTRRSKIPNTKQASSSARDSVVYKSRDYNGQSRNEAQSPNDNPRPDNRNALPQASFCEDLGTVERNGHIEQSDMVEQTTLTESELIEQRRKRREALRMKHRSEAPLLQQALNTSANSTLHTLETQHEMMRMEEVETPISTPASPKSPFPESPRSPLSIAVSDDADLACNNGQVINDTETADGPPAADYDPSMDMQENKLQSAQVINNENNNDGLKQTKSKNVGKQKNAINSNDGGDDDDAFDMFADDVDVSSPQHDNDVEFDEDRQRIANVKGQVLEKGMLDDWDDAEGYYKIILGELLDHKRYQIQSVLGKGVFSAVVRALDVQLNKQVAIKVNRKQETMYKAALKEIATLEKLAEADPEDKKHIIRVERNFMHKGHLCIVFENMSVNLRDVLKKFGRDIGINIKAVRAYAQQMFLGLSLLRRCDILHADLKPDNILVNENRSQLKIADLGSAFDIHDSEVTEELVSPFYRAPEIILGIKGDFALDMWSIGCTLFEMYTGKICFTGVDNNQMLKSIMDCRGKIPNRMLKRSAIWAKHFDIDGTFLSREVDDLTRREITRPTKISRPIPAKELNSRLMANSSDLNSVEMNELKLFADLLDKCLVVDPLKRITPNEALRHGFISHAAGSSLLSRG